MTTEKQKKLACSLAALWLTLWVALTLMDAARGYAQEKSQSGGATVVLGKDGFTKWYDKNSTTGATAIATSGLALGTIYVDFRTGKVTMPPEMLPDDAARQFWLAVEREYGKLPESACAGGGR